jgi:3',5'-nucleoside bisphosphate phosphatase
MTGFDLHTHSTASDGTTSVTENVCAAGELGLEGLAVTDHDTTDGFEEAVAAAEAAGVEVVLGTEFSAEHEGRSVHVLGYWIDPGDGPLATELDRLRNERDHRARAIVDRFNDLGVAVSLSRVRELAGEASIARPHIAAAAVEAGAAASTQEVFDTWLADEGPAYVEKQAVDPVRAVELLVGAGGVAVLAHPGLYGKRDGLTGTPDELVERMVAAGLSGIEAHHADHTQAHRERYADLARALGLVVTAGSDYHGDAKPNRLGSATVGRAVVEELRGHGRIARGVTDP